MWVSPGSPTVTDHHTCRGSSSSISSRFLFPSAVPEECTSRTREVWSDPQVQEPYWVLSGSASLSTGSEGPVSTRGRTSQVEVGLDLASLGSWKIVSMYYLCLWFGVISSRNVV